MRLCFSLSVHYLSVYSDSTVLRVFTSFGVGALCEEWSNRREFHENRLSDSHTLLHIVNEHLLILHIILAGSGGIRYKE